MTLILFFYSQYFDMLIRFGAKIQTEMHRTRPQIHILLTLNWHTFYSTPVVAAINERKGRPSN